MDGALTHSGYAALQASDMPTALCGAGGEGPAVPVATPAASTAPVPGAATTEALVAAPTTSAAVPPAASLADNAQITAPPGVAA